MQNCRFYLIEDKNMPSTSHNRTVQLKRKRRSSESTSDVENEPENEEKKIRTERSSVSIDEEPNDILQLLEFSPLDERAPLNELNLTNNRSLLHSDESDSDTDSDISSINTIMARLKKVATHQGMASWFQKVDINLPPGSSGYCVLPRRFNQTTNPFPVLSWADENVLWQFLNRKDHESKRNRCAEYFALHPSIQCKMRSVLLEWLLEVCSVYKLQRETYFLAVDYLDRYLSLTVDISKKQLQLIGVTCLLIAAKVEEIYPPKVTEFAYITDGACMEADILTTEIKITKVLDWKIVSITPISWLSIFLQTLYHGEDREKELEIKYAQFPVQSFEVAAQLLDFCSLDERFLNFPYKVLAIAALFVTGSNAVLSKELPLEEMRKCETWMREFWTVLKSHSGLAPVQHPPKGEPVKQVNKKKTLWESICKHHVNLEILETAQKRLKNNVNDEEDHGLLTPPLSNKKNK